MKEKLTKFEYATISVPGYSFESGFAESVSGTGAPSMRSRRGPLATSYGSLPRRYRFFSLCSHTMSSYEEVDDEGNQVHT
eukprot:4160887-Amphidinium_carterae.1